MGLETHVDLVLDDHGFHGLYCWDDGLVIEKSHEAWKIMRILDRTNEFGPTRYNNKTCKIEFGVHWNWIEDIGIIDYGKYCMKFKNFEIGSNYEVA